MAILRALQDSREGMSGRAVARQAHINHQACALALRNLESLGLIQRQGAGRTQLVRLNFDNHLVKELILPLLRKERDLVSQTRREIADAFRSKALTITLFGSVARGQDVPGSDVDVLITSESADRDRLLKRAETFSTEFSKRYGLHLSPIVMTLSEARKRFTKSEPLLKNIVSEGIDLLPRRLQKALQ